MNPRDKNEAVKYGVKAQLAGKTHLNVTPVLWSRCKTKVLTLYDIHNYYFKNNNIFILIHLYYVIEILKHLNDFLSSLVWHHLADLFCQRTELAPHSRKCGENCALLLA